MADEKVVALAKKVYDKLCATIEHMEWKYDKDEANLAVHFTVNGDDIPMRFTINVDTDKQIISVLSPLPFAFSEGKLTEGAVATCVATYELADGSFDYNISNGSIMFRLTASYRESLIGEGLFRYLISCSCSVVDEYNDKFLAIDKGFLSIDDLIEDK